jgi:uncharacterized protein (TIGR02246 family)
VSGATSIATELFAQLEAAWNRGDGTAFGAVFTDDSDFVDVRGAHHHGAAAIGAGHQAIFASTHAGSKVRYVLESARRIADGTVLAIVGATLDAPTGPLQGVNRSRITAVITEDAERLSITAFHNTLVRAEA